MSFVWSLITTNLPLISGIFLGAFFLLTGLDKLVHYRDFLHALDGYVLMPKGIATFAAYPIIFAELWIGVGLLVAPWRKVASLIAAPVLFLFAVALSVNYLWKPESSCGCWFSVWGGKVNLLHVAQNITLSALALYVWKNSTAATSISANPQ